MIDAGMKDANPGADALVDLTVPRGPHPPVMQRGKRPAQLPSLPEGHRLFGSLDQGFGEKLYLIESLEDAQYLWDKQDFALEAPMWYSGPVLFTEDNLCGSSRSAISCWPSAAGPMPRCTPSTHAARRPSRPAGSPRSTG